MTSLPGADLPRRQSLDQLASEQLDVLVVGGGIVGSGVARDAAMRGLRTALIEQHDLASGTSSRSTRLLHGGLRYLEQGRVGLVHEASVEKKIIHRIAPHLAEPLGFIFPTYRDGGRPLWQLRLGVKLYDLLCGGRNFQPSRGFDRGETMALLPGLKAEGLAGSVRYFDALTNDSRLVIDTLRSAARHGGTVLNYVRLLSARRDAAGWNCEVHDAEQDRRLTVRARAVVNATGPWAGQIAPSTVRLRLSKGIHLVVRRERLPVPSAVVITEGRRLLFVIPWGERVIIGTTDTDYRGAPEDVAIGAEDVAYVLGIVHEFFPQAGLTESDLVGGWAGLRPLIANPDGSPSDISRAHQITMPEQGWWDIAGGKLTTYRLMAEQAVDQIARHLGGRIPASSTAQETILLPEEMTPYSGINPAPFTRAAVAHYVRHEWARHLEDVLHRRSGWHFHDRLSPAAVAQVAGWMAAELQWSPERVLCEIGQQGPGRLYAPAA